MCETFIGGNTCEGYRGGAGQSLRGRERGEEQNWAGGVSEAAGRSEEPAFHGDGPVPATLCHWLLLTRDCALLLSFSGSHRRNPGQFLILFQTVQKLLKP